MVLHYSSQTPSLLFSRLPKVQLWTLLQLSQRLELIQLRSMKLHATEAHCRGTWRGKLFIFKGALCEKYLGHSEKLRLLWTSPSVEKSNIFIFN